MKDNFLLKKDKREIFKNLSDEDAGKLIKGIYDYVCDDANKLDGYLKVIFIPFKEDIDRNELEYQKRCELNRNNGSKGGAPKGNQNAKKYSTDDADLLAEIEENNQKQPKTTERLKKQPKTTENNMTRHNHIHIHNNKLNNNNKLDINNKLNNNLDIIKKIIDYLNNKTNSNFKYNTKITQEKIIARLNEGYKLDDFIVVIDKKTDEWLNNDEFSRYLCPETLFGSKFEKYLNQKAKKRSQPIWINDEIKSTIATKEEQEKIKKMLEETDGKLL